MDKKYLKLGQIAALVLSVAVTVFVMLRAASGSFDAGTFLFMLWAVSPYVCFYFAGVTLGKLLPMPQLPLVLCVISLLMLGSTTATYLGTAGVDSSTYPLIFLFVPLYLFLGSFILLAAGLALALLVKRYRGEKLPQKD